MRQVYNCWILFNKETKQFHSGNGDSCDEIKDAWIYKDEEDAINEKNYMDEPDMFEIWGIDIIYQTK